MRYVNAAATSELSTEALIGIKVTKPADFDSQRRRGTPAMQQRCSQMCSNFLHGNPGRLNHQSPQALRNVWRDDRSVLARRPSDVSLIGAFRYLRKSLTPKCVCAIGLMVANLTVPVAAQTSNLTVKMEGLRSAKGAVWFCLWKEGQADFPKCNNAALSVARLKATVAAPAVTFKNITPGTYAVSAMHDESGTGDGEFNVVGMPKFGVGLSNSPTLGMTNRPTFEKGQFTVPETKALSINANYLF